MRQVVMHGPGDVRVEDREDPRIIEPTDAIIRLAATCICGSDLWPYRGAEPVDHQVMGHEYVGVVEEVGDEVRTIKVGDFVVGSFWASDNTCEICQAGYQAYCVHRVLIGTLGTQSELARIPLVLGALVTGLALGVACLAVWATKLPRKGQYSPTVWHSTLGLRRKEHLPYVVLELKDDERRVQGVLHSYTTLDGDHPRDIALMAPKVSVDGSTWDVGADYVVVSSEEIAKIWLRLAHDPGQARKRR